MLIRLPLIHVIFNLLVSPSVAADWQLVKDRDGIKVYTQQVIGSDIKQYKGIMSMSYPIDQIVAVLLDVQACPKWLHQCVYGKTLQHIKFGHSFIYQQHELPFPVKNRDVILETSIAFNSDSEAISIKNKAYSKYCINNELVTCNDTRSDGFIRVSVSEGVFYLEPVSRSKTRVSWQQHTEPGGSIPKWLVNALLIDIPYFSLRNLNLLASSEKYRNAELVYAKKNRQPVDLKY